MRELVREDGSALSHALDDWHAIDWRRVERNVRGMQIRIAKATRESDWRRVKALQRRESIVNCGKRLQADWQQSAG
jgi:RNA-directed DNA polymerase